MKKCKKLLVDEKRLGVESIGPKPPALCSIQNNRSKDMINIKGADRLWRKRIDSTPHHTTTIFRSQNPRKQIHRTQGMWVVCGSITATIAAIAWPPSHD